jgi:MFS family permease
MTFSLVAVAALANGLLIGLIPTLIDGLKPAIQARLNLPEGRIEWHVRLFYLAWLPGMPLAGWLLDATANRDVLLYAGLLPLILGMAWLGLARNSASAFFNAIFLGLGYSVLTTATVRLMTVAFFPDYVNEYRLNIASLNLGFVAIGVGAILGPYLVKAIEQWTGVRQGLLYISIAMLAPAVLTALCESSAFPSNVQDHGLAIGVFSNTIMAMIAVVILLYFALETCLEFWPEAYLKEIGYEGRAFKVGVLVFWLAFVLSRLAAAWLFYEHPSLGPPLTLILLIASAVILGNLAGGFEIGSGSLGFWLLGVCYGPLLPGFLGIALDSGAPLPTSALGMLLALSGIDTLVLRPFLAGATRNYKPRSVMFVPTIVALLATAVLLVLGFV